MLAANQTINLTKHFWGFVWPSKAPWFWDRSASKLHEIIGNHCQNALKEWWHIKVSNTKGLISGFLHSLDNNYCSTIKLVSKAAWRWHQASRHARWHQASRHATDFKARCRASFNLSHARRHLLSGQCHGFLNQKLDTVQKGGSEDCFNFVNVENSIGHLTSKEPAKERLMHLLLIDQMFVTLWPNFSVNS